MPAVKMMSPNTTIWWIDKEALTTPEAPKVTEMVSALSSTTADEMAVNLSPAIVAGYTLNPTDSDTQSSQSIVDEGSGETRGYANYDGSLGFFREADPATNTESEYLAAYELFKHKGRVGYLMRRLGKKFDKDLAEDDWLDIFLFQSWTPRVTTDTNGGAIQFTVPFLKQGFLKTNVQAQA